MASAGPFSKRSFACRGSLCTTHPFDLSPAQTCLNYAASVGMLTKNLFETTGSPNRIFSTSPFDTSLHQCIYFGNKQSINSENMVGIQRITCNRVYLIWTFARTKRSSSISIEPTSITCFFADRGFKTMPGSLISQFALMYSRG